MDVEVICIEGVRFHISITSMSLDMSSMASVLIKSDVIIRFVMTAHIAHSHAHSKESIEDHINV